MNRINRKYLLTFLLCGEYLQSICNEYQSTSMYFIEIHRSLLLVVWDIAISTSFHLTPAQLNWMPFATRKSYLFPAWPSIFFSQSPSKSVCSVKMPDVLIVNDNASFASSDTFSTQNSIEQPRHSPRRRNTVAKLTRRVSKRISQTILKAGVQEHALSEKNLKDLNDATDIDPRNLCSSPHQVHRVEIYDPIHETIEECPILDVEAAREMRLHQSYATFCQNFTLSGTTKMSRKFDLSMGAEWAEEHTPSSHTDPTLSNNNTSEFSGSGAYPEHITVHSRPRPSTVAFPISSPSTDLEDTPISHSATIEPLSLGYPVTKTSEVEEDFNSISSNLEITANSNYPQPPPRIITPTVWMDMKRNEREHKATRRQRLLNPFRSWFMTSQPLWGRRHEVVE